MAAICSFTCGGGAQTPPQRYDDPCVNSTRKYGFAYFALVKCDEAIDITSAAAVDAAVTAGDIACSPFGRLVINAPTFENIELGCDREIQGELEYLIDYETYQTNPGDDECSYFEALRDNAIAYTWLGIDCEGMVYHDAGANPGYRFSVSIPPYWTEGDAGLGKWVTQFKIVTNKIICPRFIAGIDAVLCN